MDEPVLLKVRAVANLLGVSVRTVEGLLARTELPSLLIGRARRIRRADVDEYIARRLAAETHATEIHVTPLAPDAPPQRRFAPFASTTKKIRRGGPAARGASHAPGVVPSKV